MAIADLHHKPARPSEPSQRLTEPALAFAGRVFADARMRALGFAYLFAVYSFVQPYGYRRAYPKALDRIAFATSFGNNKGLRILYGEPYNLLSVSGYTAWRVGGTLAIAAAVFGILAAVRALRAEEDAGRAEVVLAAQLSRRGAYIAVMGAIGCQALVLFAAEFVGFLVGGLPPAGSAYLAARDGRGGPAVRGHWCHRVRDRPDTPAGPGVRERCCGGLPSLAGDR